MKNLFIVKSITEDRNISDETFTVWCGLRNIMQKNVTTYFVSYNLIAHSIFNRAPSRYEIDVIKKGYNDLIKKGYIKVISVYSKSEQYIDLSALYYQKDNGFFADLTDDEMHQIVNIKGSHNKYKLLRYFTCQVGSFNRSLDLGKLKGKIGGCSLEHFTTLMPITKPTVNAFNKLLEDNELLYVIRHNDFYQGSNIDGNSRIREIPNTYSRWCDRYSVTEYMESKHGYKYFTEDRNEKNIKSNQKRSLGQKTYCFFNKGTKYDIDTIRAIYVYADEKNKVLKKAYDEDMEKGLKASEPTYYDMSKFGNYLVDFI